jgi:outer membrane protein assembly factor BamB
MSSFLMHAVGRGILLAVVALAALAAGLVRSADANPAGNKKPAEPIPAAAASKTCDEEALAQNTPENRAERLLRRLGASRGICVLLDPQPAELAAALAQRSELLIYCQVNDQAAARAARQKLAKQGLLGRRVFVEAGSPERIHLADRLADAVIVTQGAAAWQMDEEALLRVVNPLGQVLLPDAELSRPYPEAADEWTHPYHSPTNNPLSADRLACNEPMTQYLAAPWYVPMPGVTVSARGRLFKAFGHVAYHEREWQWMNRLVAMNAYNGVHLWQRGLEPGFMIHRNTMIATPEVLLLGDNRSCKLLDAATGELCEEIAAPPGAAGPCWKWMALQDGVLYALVGEREAPDPPRRDARTHPGWPWRPMSEGYDTEEYRWGFGRTLFAMDFDSRRVLWQHTEPKPIDSRALCMNRRQLFVYAHGHYLKSIAVDSGEELWNTQDAKLLEAIGPHFKAQNYKYGFSSQTYAKCSDEHLFLAGPQRSRLVAVAADDGSLLWQFPEGNFQLILRDDALYAMGRTHESLKFDPATGKVIAKLPALRGNCTRVTATPGSLFARGNEHGGTLQLLLANDRPRRIALMRPPCHDGVIVAGGLLHWGPWMCDCNLSLVGQIGLAPAPEVDRSATAVEATRLTTLDVAGRPVAPLPIGDGDWPQYRADAQCSAASSARVPAEVAQSWQFTPPTPCEPSAPVVAGEIVFVGSSEGALRAIDLTEGSVRWQAFTGGPIAFAPAIADDRLLAGSGDGSVYAYEAVSGRPLWRFRAAPVERKIHVHGRLLSTWPVGSGVLVDGNTVYAAAGIASYDGTHMYALDVASGRIQWQNNSSGELAPEGTGPGVSVQGSMLLHDGKLHLAGGNVVSPAVYDTADGTCLNRLEDTWAKAARGRDLFLVGDRVVPSNQLLYAPEKYHPSRYFPHDLLQAHRKGVLIRGYGPRVARIDEATAEDKKPRVLWQSQVLGNAVAMALGSNAVVVAGALPQEDDQAPARYAAVALRLSDGRPIWTHRLPAMPRYWGVALSASGHVVTALRSGRMVCLGPKG